jgi:hypothetical protein
MIGKVGWSCALTGSCSPAEVSRIKDVLSELYISLKA